MGPIYTMKKLNFPPVADVPAVVMATVNGGTPICSAEREGTRPKKANKQFTISWLIKNILPLFPPPYPPDLNA